MMPARTLARRRVCRTLPGVLLLVIVLIGLVAAGPALAKSGRVGPVSRTAWAPGALAARLARGADTWYGIWDAQPTGALTYASHETAPQMTLTATDAAGKSVWSAASGDIWAASGTLPAALVATFPNGNPNVLRDGELTAYDASGHVRFHKAFKNEFVQPLTSTLKRLVWVEASANGVARVYVRQGSKTRTHALPYRSPNPGFVSPATASATGSRLLIGVAAYATNQRNVVAHWVRVDGSGTPRVVARRMTNWVAASLTPNGDHAAVMPSAAVGGVGNRWVAFGKFGGQLLEGEDSSQIDASAHRIFVQGAYIYGDDTAGWSTYMLTVMQVFQEPMAVYQRAWTFDDSTSSIWFRHDGRIVCLAGVDDKGALTVANSDTWAIASVPGTYADAVPIDGGRLATMTQDGTLAFVADPVAGP